MQRSALLRIAVVLAFLEAASASATTVQDSLAGLSLEELSNVRIISVSRREERLADAPAAVFIITSEDMRRSGATRLIEALRLAPNLQVATANASGQVASARGHANSDGNKLLVLIDGRSVYSPLFSGVFWNAHDMPLDLVERIEVISGPGGTLWCTNFRLRAEGSLGQFVASTLRNFSLASSSRLSPERVNSVAKQRRAS